LGSDDEVFATQIRFPYQLPPRSPLAKAVTWHRHRPGRDRLTKRPIDQPTRSGRPDLRWKKNASKEPPRLGVKNHLQRGSDSSNKFYQWSRCKVDDKTHTGNPTAETMSGVRTGIGRHKNKTTRKLHWSGHRRL